MYTCVMIMYVYIYIYRERERDTLFTGILPEGLLNWALAAFSAASTPGPV